MTMIVIPSKNYRYDYETLKNCIIIFQNDLNQIYGSLIMQYKYL